MKATIRVSEDEIRQILRERVLKLTGVDKVTLIEPVLEHNRIDERTDYKGHDIHVELTEIVSTDRPKPFSR